MIARGFLVRQWLDDRRYQRHHRRHASDDGYRLIRLADDCSPPWSDEVFLPYIGYRAWCDGRRHWCPCGERCCDCAHTERPNRV